MIAYKPNRRTALRRFTTLARRPAATIRAIAAAGKRANRPTPPVHRIPVIITTDPQLSTTHLVVAQMIGAVKRDLMLLGKPHIQAARASEYPQGPTAYLHLTGYQTEFALQRRPAQGFGLPGIIILFTDNPDQDIRHLTEHIESHLNHPGFDVSALNDPAFHLSDIWDIGELHHHDMA